MKKDKKLTILSKEEVTDIFDLPKFSKDERQEFFSLSDEQEAALAKIKEADTQAYFILQLGYFKCRRRLIPFTFAECYQDLRFINSKYFKVSGLPKKMPSRKAITKSHTKIMDIMGYKPLKGDVKAAFENFVVSSARKSLYPRSIFSDMIDYLDENKVALPEYSYLNTLIGKTVESEMRRIGKIVQDNFNDATHLMFENIFLKNAEIYDISAIKRQAKDFKIGEAHREAEINRLMEPLFEFCSTCISKFELSTLNINYLASLLDHYSRYKLDRMRDNYSSVFLCCFLFFRYMRSNDILIESLQHWIRKYRQKSTNHAKEMIYQEVKNGEVEKTKIANLVKMFNDRNISSDAKFGAVRERAYKTMKPKEIDKFVASMLLEPPAIGKFRWQYFKDNAKSIKKNLRPIFRALDFTFKKPNDPLIKAIDLLREAIDDKKPLSDYEKLPTAFVPPPVRKIIVKNGHIDPDLFEIVVYYQIINKFEGATLFIKDSKESKRLIDDLISDEMWLNRESIIKELPYSKLKTTAKENLEVLEAILEEQILLLNQELSDGSNSTIKRKKSKKGNKWSVEKFDSDEDVNNPFFGTLKQRNICDILYYVHKKTGFLKHFTHIAPRYAKGELNERQAIACIVAAGANLGLSKMASISNISFDLLSQTYQNYFRAQTLSKACAGINNGASKLFVFDAYKVGNEIHASADGQKFRVKHNLYKARYSPKYLGSRRGVVSDSLMANHLPVNARIIGSNQHESYFLYDLVFKNITDIDPKTISTDMHGVNKVNFAFLYMFDKEFSPRYKGIDSRINSLYGFKKLSSYEELEIQPFNRINKRIIIKEWDNILRILLSLATKEVSQSTIVRKLSSHKLNDKTKTALWELDNIIRTIDTIKYLRSEFRRKNINKVLCRGEAYHQLKRAVVNIGGESLKGATESDISIWDECSRLITSCIIYYNMDLLSKIMEHAKIKDSDMLPYFSSISPVAWLHINFLGKYEINEVDFEFDVSSIMDGVTLEDLVA